MTCNWCHCGAFPGGSCPTNPCSPGEVHRYYAEVVEAAQAVAGWRNFSADYATTQDIAAHASDFARLEQALSKFSVTQV